MFVANDVELGVPFVTARPRLMELIAGRALADASRAAFDEGLAQLAHLAQPDRPSLARLMRGAWPRGLPTAGTSGAGCRSRQAGCAS